MKPLILFLFVFFIVALTINTKNQRDFNLQHMGVEALAERGTFALEGSRTPGLQPLGDTFKYKGHVYAIKQPGQFVIASIVYKVLLGLGFTYYTSYSLTAALVTLFTSGVFAGLIAICLYRISVSVTGDIRLSLMIGLFSVTGTLLLPYSGLPHHDLYATALITLSLMLLVVPSKNNQELWLAVAGLFAGLTLFVSMLPVVICIVLGLYVLAIKGQRSLFFYIGSLIGILPMFVINTFLFGDPFAFANLTSGTTDTNSMLSLPNIVEKLQFYLISPSNSLFVFSPLLLLATVGLCYFPKKHKMLGFFCLGVAILHVLYLSTIETVGHAQYGPRYLLPIIPFLSMGLIGFRNLKAHLPRLANQILMGIVFLFALLSIAISVVGALGGVMVHDLSVHPFTVFMEQMWAGELSKNPLIGLGVLGMSCVGVLWFLYHREK